MSIQVTRERLDGTGVERCCFCRNRTPFWYEARDVACCDRCAKFARHEDVPLKSVWCIREEIVMRATGEMMPTNGRRGTC